jgi:uncharacterized protein (TIGR03435 family)
VANEYYEVNAKVPPRTTKEQVKGMWQNLLAERFNLKFHFSKKDFPVYELTVAKNGPKLRKSGEGSLWRPGIQCQRRGPGTDYPSPRFAMFARRFWNIPWRTSASNSRGM